MNRISQATAKTTYRSETAKLEVKKGTNMTCLYSIKQKETVVAYAKMHSVAAAARHLPSLGPQ